MNAPSQTLIFNPEIDISRVFAPSLFVGMCAFDREKMIKR